MTMPVKSGDFLTFLSDIFISIRIKWESLINLMTEGFMGFSFPLPK